MAVIDSKKLLPTGKSGGAIVESQKPFLVPVSNILYKKDVNISQELLKPAEKGTQEPGEAIVVIKDKVLRISDIIGNTYLIQQSENNRKRKENERQKAEDREKKLETKKPTEVNKNNLAKIAIPGASILDTINRFIGFTLLGYLFDKYSKFLPKLLEFGKYIAPVVKFIESFGKNLVNSVINFIDAGYKAYDNVHKSIEQIGGKDAAKTFDEFSKNLNILLNGSIAAAMLIASTTPQKINPKVGFDETGRKVGQKAQTRYLERYGEKQFSQRFGKKNLQKLATRQATEGAAKQVATQGAKQSLKSIAAVPIVGALIGFIIDTVVFREKPSRAAAGAVGSALGSALGIALAGGTTFGLGAGVGLFVGGWAGDWLGKTLYDGLTGHKQEPIQGRAQGGQVTSGQSGVASTRKIKTTSTRKQPKTYTSPKIQPGRDIGGKLKIEELYGKDEPGKRSALRALTKSSADLKRMRSLNGIAGSMFGAGIDMALGQKPDKKLANSLGDMFGSVVAAAVNAELNSSFNDISKTLGMANGGVVPSREIRSGMNIGEKIGRYISNALALSIEGSASKILQNLNRELNLEGGPPSAGSETSDSGPGPGTTGGDGDAGDFSGNTKAIKAFNYFKSQGYTDYQSAAIVGNLLQENRGMNPTLTNSIGMKGIAQWDENRWSNLGRFAKSKNLNPNDFETQLQFIQHELKTGDGGLSANTFKSTKNLEDATVMFRKKYERPGEAEANDAARIKYARSVINTSGATGLSAKGVKKFGRADITSLFGQQESFRSKPHEGMDIAAPQGTPISFGMGGEVLGVYRTTSTSRDANGGYGNYMDVKFSDGKIARIAHLSSIPSSISKGSTFKANQVIANSGGEEGKPGSGRSGGPHIHLEQLSKPMGIQETTKGKYDPMKGGLFQRIQSGGTRASIAPSQQLKEIASLQQHPSYSQGGLAVIHDVNNIVMPVMIG
jgi:murein DD-endopeptidase MepM/ murein hydrolase activator NlpD/F0F1-type ATP synthase assembly protein I